MSLPPALMPATQLNSGDHVRIVATPGAQGDVATGTIPKSIEATVVGVRGSGDTGQIVVDVSVLDPVHLALAAGHSDPAFTLRTYAHPATDAAKRIRAAQSHVEVD